MEGKQSLRRENYLSVTPQI